jgi:hypothetical protein
MGTPLITSGYSNSPISNITPFTYRDGETYLEQLHRLRKWFYEVTTVLQSNIQFVDNKDKDALADLAEQFNATILNFTNTYQQLLLNALNDSSNDILYDPTSGVISPFALVVGHVYDNLRYYAYFADQLDSFEYTAKEWDDMQYTARHFDLALAYSSTHTQDVNVMPPVVTPS